MSHAGQVRGKATAVGGGEGPHPGRRGGRISDDIIMAGFGWFASLLVSGTGASNRTFTTQLSDRRETKISTEVKQMGREFTASRAGKISQTVTVTQSNNSKTKWRDELQENIRMPETMSWWMKGGVKQRRGQEELQEWWDVKHRSENQRSG